MNVTVYLTPASPFRGGGPLAVEGSFSRKQPLSQPTAASSPKRGAHNALHHTLRIFHSPLSILNYCS